ncbi:NAD(P)H-hydrate dehydratase [Hoyosella sp. YIM 151337]|uniref:NAD(P)H-hydrate dehydratase n=1 Tax=Hoyosella sp. YIM 151337 TaxID=2992742 RepID=UPI0022360DD6|nr:NAD(P)H-hydrate dehydratase [Hoyosella sp. YIM 151337]MCW4352517.1 NAD(P)H-hydrate dehydratase [Hoyosella sp. YIM 151337]
MSVPYFTADEIRAAEAKLFARVAAGVPMRRASWGLAAAVALELRRLTGAIAGTRAGLLIGSGDNGGDALWAGAFLCRRGVAVEAVLLNPDRAHKAGLQALVQAGGRVVTRLSDNDIVVDGIVGISGKGPLRPEAALHVAKITAPIVAVDLPSGVDPDTGEVSGPAVRATLTVTFGGYKRVHALAPRHCGRVVLVGIGLDLPHSDVEVLTDREVGARWPVPEAADDKYTQGVVGVAAGSAVYPGAAVLSVGGAVAARSGMVRYTGTAHEQVLARYPEVIAAEKIGEAGRVQAWVAGPGFGTGRHEAKTLAAILDQDVATVLDADALTMAAKSPELVRGRQTPTLLTPHAGEFARLTGSAPDPDRIGAAQQFAADWGATVLLKGRSTIIARPDGRVRVCEAGSSWAATAGSGDVLSGIIGALLASGLEPFDAAAMGAHVHARAAFIAAGSPVPAPISASLLRDAIRPAISSVRAAAQHSGVADAAHTGKTGS